MPSVSVIIPTYNRPDYLAAALESVRGQTFTDWEALVIDDGPTLEAEFVVHSLNDARFKYLPQTHAGRSAARNLGMRAARGRYIALLDDDDIFLPDKLAHQVDYLDRHQDVDLTASGVQIIDAQGEMRRVWRCWLTQPNLTLLSCLYSCPLVPSTVLLKRERLDRLDYWFDSNMESAEDVDFFVRLLCAGCVMAWWPEIVTLYRVHAGNSQQDGARYSQAYQGMLDRLYSRMDVPPEVLAARDHLYAVYWLSGACFCYATRHIEQAQFELLQAVTLRPQSTQGSLPTIVEAVASFANDFRVDNPQEYIDLVFDHLPPSLSFLERHRNETQSIFHMRHVFTAYEHNEPVSLRHLLLGIWYSPRWLRNRGVWSIMATATLGPKRAERLRVMMRSVRGQQQSRA